MQEHVEGEGKARGIFSKVARGVVRGAAEIADKTAEPVGRVAINVGTKVTEVFRQEATEIDTRKATKREAKASEGTVDVAKALKDLGLDRDSLIEALQGNLVNSTKGKSAKAGAA